MKKILSLFIALVLGLPMMADNGELVFTSSSTLYSTEWTMAEDWYTGCVQLETSAFSGLAAGDKIQVEVTSFNSLSELTAGQYFLYTEDNMFHPAAKAKDASETYVNVGAFKCYFTALPEVTVQARANSVVFGIYGEATGISEVLNASNNSKGVNGKLIQNGRVVIVKDGKKYNLAGQIVK